MRQQIESRNPLAFTPKIVSSSPMGGEGAVAKEGETPARHKKVRGELNRAV
jgi:hypothetical protein